MILAAGILLMAPLLGISAFSNPAKAQAYRNMTCGELWYARNAIYARQGYCFKTVRARQVFGPRCYEPWGRLTPAQQRRVDQIIYWERYYGCRR
ncbi:YARHG domain-containing protein [uncultured Cohaesibacter sp.]|uniref:YARHG domain-containing protein n=1 Tax=uncultured Cohaesibacter sp. TaxID=1002546 RepID=UPI0029C81FE4|nr:YARHG domain-containing protein [uncultured Cohaesibacter sp.]